LSLWNGIEMYGRSMTLYSKQRPLARKIRAFLQPINQEEHTSQRKASAPGYFDKRTYLFIAAPYALDSCETEISVICGGIEYELLRAELMMLGDEVTHWEGILRPVGRVTGDV
jgi:hypothetical protein